MAERWKLKAMQAVIAVSVFYVVVNLSGPGPLQTRHIVWATAVTLGVLALLPIYPLVRFKPQERTLTVTNHGISTTIGSHRGEIPWSKIESVTSDADRIYIIGKNQNSFIVPLHAFSAATEREEFIVLAQQSLDASRKPSGANLTKP